MISLPTFKLWFLEIFRLWFAERCQSRLNNWLAVTFYRLDLLLLSAGLRCHDGRAARLRHGQQPCL